ncbi:MAG TPA: flagellar export chaperone FliS [Bryobacteraceae bacterium]|nr:flagellar export chaperone FliS [Bryobacteraceae bacterium]
MRIHGYQNYFDNEVLVASPLRLIEMMYAGALDSIAAARRHLIRRDIPARTRAINKAFRLVTELSQCLDHEAGGELSTRLAALYRYVLRLLIQANAQQSEAPLTEAEALLATLAEAWKACSPTARETDLPNTDLANNDPLPLDTYVVSHPPALAR